VGWWCERPTSGCNVDGGIVVEEEWKFEEMYIPGTIVDQINNCKIGSSESSEQERIYTTDDSSEPKSH
jgi:hypothetical protein